jgi:hypothetical protein
MYQNDACRVSALPGLRSHVAHRCFWQAPEPADDSQRELLGAFFEIAFFLHLS